MTGPLVENVQPSAGEAYYVEHGWSGCAGSAWDQLSQATRDGWEAAAREWLRAVRAESMHAEAFRIGIAKQEAIERVEAACSSREQRSTFAEHLGWVSTSEVRQALNTLPETRSS